MRPLSAIRGTTAAIDLPDTLRLTGPPDQEAAGTCPHVVRRPARPIFACHSVIFPFPLELPPPFECGSTWLPGPIRSSRGTQTACGGATAGLTALSTGLPVCACHDGQAGGSTGGFQVRRLTAARPRAVRTGGLAPAERRPERGSSPPAPTTAAPRFLRFAARRNCQDLAFWPSNPFSDPDVAGPSNRAPGQTRFRLTVSTVHLTVRWQVRARIPRASHGRLVMCSVGLRGPDSREYEWRARRRSPVCRHGKQRCPSPSAKR